MVPSVVWSLVVSILIRGLRQRLDRSCWVSAYDRKAWDQWVGCVGKIEVDVLELGL